MSTPTAAQGRNAAKRPLPEGWRWAKLGDVCAQDRHIVEPHSDEANSLTYFSLEHIESETGRILKVPQDHIEDIGKSASFRFDDRHVLYGKLRPYLNKVALPDSAGRCTVELIPLLPNENTDRGFLALLLRRPETVDFAMQHRTGSRMPRADMKSLITLEVPLPPLPEQRNIVATLNERMASVERARRAAEDMIEHIDALKNAFLSEIFALGKNLASGWRWVTLGEVCEISDSGTWGESDPLYGISVLRSTNFRDDGTLDFSDLSLRDIRQSHRVSKRLRPGDIVLERSGGGPNQPVGRVCIFYDDTREHIFGNFCQRLRTDRAICDAKFLFWYLYAFHATGQTESYQKRTTGIRNLEYKRYINQEIPLPPLAEQQRIVVLLDERIAALERAKAAAQEQLEAINALPAAWLRLAFTGEIQYDHDSS